MPRYSVMAPKIDRLVGDFLLPVVLRLGSVNATCDWLNRQLREAGAGGQLYPNRLHTILSQDASKAVNEATLRLIESVAERSPTLPPADEPAIATREGRVREEWALVHGAGDPLTALAEGLSIPRAFASMLLKRTGLGGTEPGGPPDPGDAPDLR